MSIFRTIAMFIYLFGYMIVHYGVLRRAERALAVGDMQLVEETFACYDQKHEVPMKTALDD